MEEKSSYSTIPLASGTVVLPSKIIKNLVLGCGKPLTFVTGMSGCGKTTSVAANANRLKARGGWKVIWLSVTPLDNSVSRFWNQLIKAVSMTQKSEGSSNDSFQLKLESQDNLLSLYSVEEILNILEQQNHQYYLVIDDIHHINDEYILKILNYIILHSPKNLHFVLIGRNNPGVSLYKLRMEDNVVEIGPQDLAFTQSEVKEFFQEKKIHTLSSGDIREIYDLTRGWVAGLQMVYLLLRKTKDTQSLLESFSKNSRWLLDFLVEEVLQMLNEETREFLLRTCFLESAAQDTYECVIGSINSTKAIDDLLEMNLILKVPSEANLKEDSNETWYAYHPMFSKSLRHCMEKAYSKKEIARMQAIACSWFESARCYEQAIKIALKAGDYETALRLITEHLYSVLANTESGVLIQWLENLPHPQKNGDYLYPLINAWANFIAGKTKRSRLWLEEAYAIRAKNEGETSIKGINKMFETIEVGTMVFAGEYERALEIGQLSLENLGGPQLFLRSTIMHNMGEALERVGRYEEAYEYFIRAKASSEKSGRRIISLLCSCEIGWIEYINGNLESASNVYLKAITSVHKSTNQDVWAIGLLYVSLARLYLDWGDTKKASLYIDLAHDGLSPYTNKDGYLEAQVAISQLQIMLGNVEDARDTMLAAYELLETDKTPRGVDILVPMSLAFSLLHVDQIDRADDILESVRERINSSDTYYLTYLSLLKAQVHIEREQYDSANDLLNAIAESGNEAGLKRLVIEALVLLACSKKGMGDGQGALITMTAALVSASEENLVLPFIGKAAHLKSLLYEIAYGSEKNRYLALDMEKSRTLAKTALAIHNKKEELSISYVSCEENTELLSPRELQVCELLKQGKTRNEIADILDIRLNTVRTHIRNIYKKTGVHDRALL